MCQLGDLQGWLGVARLVLPVAVADASSMEEAVQKVEALIDGLPLLHLAVRSQSASLVRRPFYSLLSSFALGTRGLCLHSHQLGSLNVQLMS